MDKNDIAAILDEIGTLLEIKGEHSFRCNAYHGAARALGNLERNLDDLLKEGTLAKVQGIGKSMVEKITTLAKTGKLDYYEELKKETPPDLLIMLKIPGMGPKKIKVLYEDLKIDTLPKLKEACQNDRIAELKGFGAKTQQKILDGLEYLGKIGNRVRLDQALAIGEILLEHLKKCPGVIRMEICGSLRRRRETAKDIDILVSSDDPDPIMEAFTSNPVVIQVVAHGETKSSVVVAHGEGQERVIMNADLRVVEDKHYPFALHYFTGSKEHNVAIRARAQDYGLKLNEYELVGTGNKKSIACKEEADIFRALDLDYIPPELRENTGEIASAAHRALPDLLQYESIQGVFHNHTTYSDGGATLEEMAQAAKKLGFKYLGIADHSQSLTVANGLTPERVKQQHQEIDALNKKLKGIHLFKGIECDILPDGSLDFSDEVLKTFNYVVASVHMHFNQTEEEMTKRIIKAISNPYVTMLGHATGRLILRRDGYKVNLDEILQAAAKNNTLIEINAQPQRLDLDWIHCKRAKSLGVQLVINPDAHSTEELALTRFGVFVAQRGWLEKKNVFNTKGLAEVKKVLAAAK